MGFLRTGYRLAGSRSILVPSSDYVILSIKWWLYGDQGKM